MKKILIFAIIAAFVIAGALYYRTAGERVLMNLAPVPGTGSTTSTSETVVSTGGVSSTSSTMPNVGIQVSGEGGGVVITDVTGQNETMVTGNLSVVDNVVGTGAEAKNGSKVSVQYTGKLENGTVFDSSVKRGPFTFTLGAGEVIEGWDKGVLGMKVGGKRKLIIPPAFAYGDRAVGTIPANSTLIFDIELLSVE